MNAKTRKRRVVVPLVLLLAAGIGLGAYAIAGNRGSAPPAYQTATVDRGAVVPKITATGTLSALVTVDVGSQVSGRIETLYVDYNSRVEKGQVLARLDPELFKAAVAQTTANYEAAVANLAKARAQAEDADLQAKRQENLAARSLVAQADADTARSAAKVAEAQVAAARAAVHQAQAARDQARINLGYTTIVSPISGVVISRNVDVGQTVAASFQAPTLFVLAEDLKRMQVDTSVAEADVGHLKAGMKTYFNVDAYPNRTFEGVVRQVRNAAQTVQNVVTYDAVIDVANPDLALKPGMTANVTFIVAERDDVLRVPNAALRFRPPAAAGRTRGHARPAGETAIAVAEGGERKPANRPKRHPVFVLRDGKPSAVLVETGIADGGYTEIVGGDLRPGDAVITGLALPAGAGAGQRNGRRPPRFL